jgi:peptidoglycan/xylan/chitin deacetylase (PgdA/CDA1 family)
MPVTMPPGKRNAVCITFDFDAVSLYLGMFTGFASQGIGRGEFAVRVGAERVLALLAEHEIATTWFVPGHTARSWPRVVQSIAAEGHEIAHHGYLHQSPIDTADREEEILVEGIEAIESVVGVRPVGYRAPSWDTTDQTVTLLLRHGFVYAANGMSDDYRPYHTRLGDQPNANGRFQYGADTKLVELPSAWHLTDYSQLEVGPPHNLAPSPREAQRIWTDEFDYMSGHGGGVLTYTFHPECIGRGHRMLMLEHLINHIRERDDVWFARALDVARAWRPDPPGLWSPEDRA